MNGFHLRYYLLLTLPLFGFRGLQILSLELNYVKLDLKEAELKKNHN